MIDLLVPIGLWVLAVICIGVGIGGTIIPALPGSPLIFIGTLIGAWANGFTILGWPSLILSGVLAVAAVLVDFVATAIGAKKVGASGAAIIGSTLGTFAGLPFALPGILLGPLIGAMVGELWAQRGDANYRQIGKVGLGTWLGLFLGTAVKVGLVGAMVGVILLGLLI